ncbi:MAG TPA: hypothetical protein VJV96_04320 [Candidatus Angelobacter sp.]|jgi:hypothetical protein|nr:hypothetical protein [Candidatus Angelobacter sp.]HKT49493.1 hypothetical protein [Candidatus Angelobacter sp.]
MKKLFTLVCVLVLGGALSVAQTGTGSSADQTTTKSDTKKPAKSKTHKAHKGGKKSKKSTTDTTPPPK